MDDEKPDFSAEQLEEIATIPQLDQVERMKPFGWTVSHLWKRDEGDILVWMIAKSVGHAKGYSHAYIDAGGKMERYYPPRIRIDFGG